MDVLTAKFYQNLVRKIVQHYVLPARLDENEMLSTQKGKAFVEQRM